MTPPSASRFPASSSPPAPPLARPDSPARPRFRLATVGLRALGWSAQLQAAMEG